MLEFIIEKFSSIILIWHHGRYCLHRDKETEIKRGECGDEGENERFISFILFFAVFYFPNKQWIMESLWFLLS